MKTALRIFVVFIGLAGAALLSGFMTPDNNAAGIQKDFGCGMMDGYGGFVVTYDDISIVNHGGNATLICKAKDVPTPGYDVVFTGMGCNVHGYFTYNSFNVVSADGNATLRCMVKKDK